MLVLLPSIDQIEGANLRAGAFWLSRFRQRAEAEKPRASQRLSPEVRLSAPSVRFSLALDGVFTKD